MQLDSTDRPGEGNLDLLETLKVLRQKAPLIAMCVVLTGAAAFSFSKAERKKYTATAQVLFRDAELDQQAAGLQSGEPDQPAAPDRHKPEVGHVAAVAAETAAVLGRGVTQPQVSGAVSVAQVSDTDLATVSAVSTSPGFAARLANAYAANVISDRQRSDANYYSTALQAVNLQFRALTPAQQNGVEGADLKDRANSLQILSQLQLGEVELEQSAVPPSAPSSPKLLRDTFLGAALGLLIGLAAAFLLQRLDRRLREPGDLETVYRAPLLGVVPRAPPFSKYQARAIIQANCRRAKQRSSASSARIFATSMLTAISG